MKTILVYEVDAAMANMANPSRPIVFALAEMHAAIDQAQLPSIGNNKVIRITIDEVDRNMTDTFAQIKVDGNLIEAQAYKSDAELAAWIGREISCYLEAQIRLIREAGKKVGAVSGTITMEAR